MARQKIIMTKKPSTSRKKSDRDFVQYSGLAFQMVAGIGIAAWGGYQVDKWWKITIPIGVICFPLIVLGVILWKILQETKRDE